MPFSIRNKLHGLLLMLGAILGFCGCGSSTSATVSGTVSFKGQALKGGKITFEDATGHVAIAEIDKNGNYSVENVPIGEVKIKVETSYLKKRAMQPSYAPPGEHGSFKPPNPQDALARYVPIPKKYEKFDSSDLKLVVKRGKNVHPIVLEGEAEDEAAPDENKPPMNP